MAVAKKGRDTTAMQGDALGKVELLAHLNRDQLRHVTERCRFMRVEKNRAIVTATEPSTDLYFLLHGRLVARGRTPDGREVRFATLEAGDMFGEFSAIDRAPRSAEIVVAKDALVACLAAAQLRELMLLVPQIALRMCELLVAKNREMSARLQEFATMNVRGRIHSALLRLTARHSGTLEAPPTQYEIAVEAGTNRETVSREMAELARRGVIEYDRQRLVVREPDGLRVARP